MNIRQEFEQYLEELSKSKKNEKRVKEWQSLPMGIQTILYKNFVTDPKTYDKKLGIAVNAGNDVIRVHAGIEEKKEVIIEVKEKKRGRPPKKMDFEIPDEIPFFLTKHQIIKDIYYKFEELINETEKRKNMNPDEEKQLINLKISFAKFKSLYLKTVEGED